ncbi:GAF domain-containing protein [Leucobacter komagatae]|uniref:GAF domain-containing protein n=2 Tax=Leucobacter komagatae TaxID=55969 RepID=A0A542Y8M2_9MICO|nr:GAF domain-containing protein [Leucobacter komagatae]
MYAVPMTDPAASTDMLQSLNSLIDAIVSEGAGDGQRSIDEVLENIGLLPADIRVLDERVRSVRGEQLRLRRREHELSALFSSARELVEIRDSALILDRLVERAHAMIGADITYLSEFDPDSRELQVRTTVGSVSSAFRGLRVPAGRGLASAIVETKAPQATQRYDDFERRRRVDSIDAAVAGEGIVSMLGVPMLSGDEVLGVLFVATREEIHFTPEQIALLSALADHASVVLQTARTLKELRRSEEDATLALERLTVHLDERNRANVVHQELIQTVLTGGGYQPLLSTLARALGRATALVDQQGVCLAVGGDWGIAEGEASAALQRAWMVGNVQLALRESSVSGHCAVVTGSSEVAAVSALVAGPQRFGTIVLGAAEGELNPVEMRTVERAAQVGALLALQQSAVTDAEHRFRSELVADLIDAAPERREELDRRISRLGLARQKLDDLLVFHVAGDSRPAAIRALRRALGDRVLIGEYQGVIVVIGYSEQLGAAEDIQGRVRDETGEHVLAVVGNWGSGLHDRFAHARGTVRLLGALGVSDATAAAADFFAYSAAIADDPGALRVFVEHSIGPVRRYDAERGTDLLGTLRAFVRNNASPTRTGRALNFHTNTILQRLERLDRILGEGWRDDEPLFRLSLAVRLDEMRERLAGRVPTG